MITNFLLSVKKHCDFGAGKTAVFLILKYSRRFRGCLKFFVNSLWCRQIFLGFLNIYRLSSCTDIIVKKLSGNDNQPVAK